MSGKNAGLETGKSKQTAGHAFRLDEKGSKHTVDEGVQDGHGTSGDTSVGVDLLED
jgi:hypothetical protein